MTADYELLFEQHLINVKESFADIQAVFDDDPDKFDEVRFAIGHLRRVFKDLNTSYMKRQDYLAKQKDREGLANLSFRYNTVVKQFDRWEFKATKQLEKEEPSQLSIPVPTIPTPTMSIPSIEIPKFSGDVRQWRAFWGAFEKYHSRADITDDQKFQLLHQSMVFDSQAYKIVSSYPAAGHNYKHALGALKETFGRDKLLIKVYMRDLMKIANDNASGKSQLSFNDLVTSLSSHIRNLEELGVSQDKFGTLLYPVVESCVPQDILQSYYRSPGYKEELEDFVDFLENEVKRRYDCELAKEQFKDKSPSSKANKPQHQTKDPKGGKTTSFVDETSPAESKCVFCKKGVHPSSECGSAAKWDLEKKRAALKEARACHKCLKVGHTVKSCNAFVTCLVCNKSHYAIMCFRLSNMQPGKSEKSAAKEDKKEQQKEVKPALNTEPSTSASHAKTSMVNQLIRPEVLMQTLTVNLHGVGGPRKIRAAYDSFSGVTHLKEAIAVEMGITPKGYENLAHQLFGGHKTSTMRHGICRISVSGLQEREAVVLDVATIPKISSEVARLPSGPYLKECEAKGIILTDHEAESNEIELLIGADYCDLLKLGGTALRLDAGPVATHTKLGWIVSGELKPVERTTLGMMCLQKQGSTEEDVQKYWSLETIGITDPIETRSREELEKSAMDHFKKTVSQDETGRYVVRLPFLESHPALPDNRALAYKRLVNMTKRLKNENMFEAYNQVFETWKAAGMIEKVEPPKDLKGCHYLPHRAVVKEGSTTPLRPVFDASAKHKNCPSLNAILEKGPNLLELIPTILTRFRRDKVGVLSDIEKAFLQILVALMDRDYQRFLWWKDSSCTELVEFRHTRVVFGNTSSPFLLGAVIQCHPKKWKCYPGTVERLLSCFYVDNAVTSVPSYKAAERFQKESQEIFEAGQFHLRGWEIGPSPEDKTVGVLGLLWNMNSSNGDTLQFDIRHLMKELECPPTKRNIYKIINMVYDPLGFASPVLITGKIILKRSCSTSKLGWDDPLPTELAMAFSKWKKTLPDLQKVSVPRHVMANSGGILTLHCFGDASRECYATTVFLRVEMSLAVRVFLIQSKTRVSPKTEATIPRLELMSCLIGARLTRSIVKDLFGCALVPEAPPVPIYYWTDSTSALTWIRKEDAWATFVQNRAIQIRNLSDVSSWRHVPGSMNPADLPSRGCSVKKLNDVGWWSGPKWLYEAEHSWPNSDPQPDEMLLNTEKKKTVVSAINLRLRAKWVDHIMRNLLSCGTYQRILKRVATVQRAIKLLTKKNSIRGPIAAEELDRAESAVVRLIQMSIEEEDVNLPLVRDASGILRVKTRLVAALEGPLDDKWTMEYPAYLPGKHFLTKRMILHSHFYIKHAGTQYLMGHLRETFWIPRDRRSIENAIRPCYVCRQEKARPVTVPEAPLPLERIQQTKVFQVTGIDVTGPFVVEKGKKVWIVLFTCAVYRAIHMEILSSMTTEAFLLALKKFVARRGRPSTIFSDNGTNFTGASKLLERVDWTKVQQSTTVDRIKWRFNPPTAAWWGGWWERLIGMVKTLLRRVLGCRSVKQAQLEVIVLELEALMNSRPLTYISQDPDDLRPLTPAHFLKDLPLAVLPELDVTDGRGLRVRWKKMQSLQEELRVRFRKEYLARLVTRKRYQPPRLIAPGSVVLVEVENQKKMDWPVGVVQQIVPGNDGVTRVATVKVGRNLLTRPVQRLYTVETNDVYDDVPASVVNE